MNNQPNGSRFDREFTPEDLAMVNLGYWDPNADDEPKAGEEHSTPIHVEPVLATSADTASAPANLAGGEPDARGSGASAISPGAPSRAPSVAVDPEAEFSRVEAIPGGLKSAIEAILTVADAPVSVPELSEALLVSEQSVERAIDALYREYNGEEGEYGEEDMSGEPRGFQLRRIAGGWKLYARDDFAPWVARFVTRSKSATLSKPAYETLAVIAYRQPVTRATVASIRGVNADAAIRQLMQRQLIREVGREAGSGATLYETTELLLAKLGLDSLDELPALAPFLPDDTEAAVLAEGND